MPEAENLLMLLCLKFTIGAQKVHKVEVSVLVEGAHLVAPLYEFDRHLLARDTICKAKLRIQKGS